MNKRIPATPDGFPNCNKVVVRSYINSLCELSREYGGTSNVILVEGKGHAIEGLTAGRLYIRHRDHKSLVEIRKLLLDDIKWARGKVAREKLDARKQKLSDELYASLTDRQKELMKQLGLTLGHNLDLYHFKI
jgi:hypothetical protein